MDGGKITFHGTHDEMIADRQRILDSFCPATRLAERADRRTPRGLRYAVPVGITFRMLTLIFHPVLMCW